MTEILRASVRQLERFRHPKILHVLHPIEECSETLAFASEAVYSSLANILAFQQEAHSNHGGINPMQAQQPTPKPMFAREYNFLDIEYKYGILQVRFVYVTVISPQICPRPLSQCATHNAAD